MIEYLRDGAEIYRRSFATIRAEAELDGLEPTLARTAVRMIHACGMVDLAADLIASADFAAVATRALGNGAPILCDTAMVAAGITRSRLPVANEVVCTLGDPGVPALARKLETTRSAAALELWRDRLEGAVAVIGNAPTALFRLLEMVSAGGPRPAVVIGVPVGFVGAAESKQALAEHPSGLPYLVVQRPPGRQRARRRRRQCAGQRGRMSVARETRTGRLFGVGVGPGDPELMTIKARRVIESSPVVAYPVARHGRSVARRVAEPYLRRSQLQIPLRYPVTTEDTDHPDGYEGALRDFYDASAAELAAHLDAGHDVAVLCEGDPFFYGSYTYLHERLAGRYDTEVIPGVTSFSAAAASTGTPLARRDEVLTVIPGTLAPEAVAARLRSTDAAVVLKLGRTFARVQEAAERAGVASRSVYVERASSCPRALGGAARGAGRGAVHVAGAGAGWRCSGLRQRQARQRRGDRDRARRSRMADS